MITVLSTFFFFFFNDTATTEIYTLSLHDALPISPLDRDLHRSGVYVQRPARADRGAGGPFRRLARGTDRRRLGPVYRLQIHPPATPAAEIAHCADHCGRAQADDGQRPRDDDRGSAPAARYSGRSLHDPRRAAGGDGRAGATAS